MSDIVPQDPDANPFIDNELIRELSEKVVDTLRPLGLTVQPESLQFMVHPEFGMVMMLQALVRPSAGEKITENKEAKEEFNLLMAGQNKARIQDQADEMKAAVEGDLEGILFGDEVVEDENECKHENMHPSGFCLDCNYGMKDMDDKNETDGTQETPQ
jgi:hypothetical protein